jgi:hypothetical protein
MRLRKVLRVRQWTRGSTFLILAAISLSSETEAAPRAKTGPLTASIIPSAKPIRSDEKATIPVEIRNVSQNAVAVTFDDGLRSYSFTSESRNTMTSDGAAEGGNSDKSGNADGCPGDVPTFWLRPGNTIVQLVAVQVPKMAPGRTTLEIVLRVGEVVKPLHCNSTVPLDLSATATVNIGR